MVHFFAKNIIVRNIIAPRAESNCLQSFGTHCCIHIRRLLDVFLNKKKLKHIIHGHTKRISKKNCLVNLPLNWFVQWILMALLIIQWELYTLIHSSLAFWHSINVEYSKNFWKSFINLENFLSLLGIILHGLQLKKQLKLVSSLL